MGISLDETTNYKTIDTILNCFGIKNIVDFRNINMKDSNNILRKDKFMKQNIFNTKHSETKMMRYLKELEKDLSLTESMIPLGSCTMKLNALVK